MLLFFVSLGFPLNQASAEDPAYFRDPRIYVELKLDIMEEEELLGSL